jgi:hypothetical protein
MKAYIINIELKDSDPLIYRKVIMPADATFKRLHDVIQNTSNFKSGYPYGGYHLYEFDLHQEHKIVTDNDDAYDEHKYYMKNKAMYQERLKSMPDELLEFEKIHQDRMKKVVRKPSGLKIDNYLEEYKEINYNYDFGDNWDFVVRLEEVVYDYHYGYPALLDGEHNAPPEDSHGVGGFYEFLEIYNDPNHPEHQETRDWASYQGYEEYSFEKINQRLKAIKYKQTESKNS